MLECKTVTLRTRPLKNGMLSYYLDYYPGYRDQETMKTIRHEGLNIYIYANPKNERERNFNATMSEKAEAIRCRRFESIVNDRYDFFDRHKLKADFLEYYRRQLRKHDQKWVIVWTHFPPAAKSMISCHCNDSMSLILRLVRHENNAAVFRIGFLQGVSANLYNSSTLR